MGILWIEEVGWCLTVVVVVLVGSGVGIGWK